MKANKPFAVKKPTLNSPKLSLFFGPPKIGKTTFISKLPVEDTLIIDTEKGTNYIEGTTVAATNYIEYISILNTVQTEVWKACKEWLLANKALYNNPKFVEALATVDVSVEGIEALPTDLDETKSVQHKVLKALRWVQEYTMANDLVAYYNLFPYKFIVIDTITEVETAANTKALADYAKTKQGAGALAKNPEAKNIMDLDIDTKWLKSRETVIELMVNRLSDACPHGILLGHVRDKYVGQEGVDMKKEKVLALTGQLGNLVMSKMDVIGYVEAKKNPVTKELERKLNFLTGKDNKAMGSRIPRLDGKILDLDGAWPHIFPFLETNTNN